MLRLFAALPIPNDIADQIVPIQYGLDGARWSPRENLHVTLRFIGNADACQAEDIDAALGEIHAEPFGIALHGIGFFGGDEPHAVWLGVDYNAPLLALHKHCERACRRAGFTPDPRAYTPHATLCYLPRHYPVNKVIAFQMQHNLMTMPPWTADRFYLYASRTQGPGPSRYSIEAEYPLIG